MTDRVKGFAVTLQQDIRIDDIEEIQKAISMIKGISNVEPSIVTIDDQINRQRIKLEYRDAFYKFVTENFT